MLTDTPQIPARIHAYILPFAARTLRGADSSTRASRTQESMGMRSFDSLELAEGFMLATGSRAIGFFSSPESTEHSVYLTVAKQLSRSPSTTPKLARATIGRGTKGCTIYMIPSAPALTPSGSYVAPLLQHRFLLPASANDYRGMEARHQFVPGSSTPDANGMTSEAWEAMLEDEAMRLHRFLQAGALRSVSELTAAAMEGPAPLLDAAAVGLLLLPRGASASVRDYHLRRMRKLADSFPRWSCDSSDPPGAPPPHWCPQLRAPPAQPAVPRRLLPHAPPRRAQTRCLQCGSASCRAARSCLPTPRPISHLSAPVTAAAEAAAEAAAQAAAQHQAPRSTYC